MRVTFFHGVLGVAMLSIVSSVIGTISLESHAQDVSANVANVLPTFVAGTTKVCDNTVSIADTDLAISACPNIGAANLTAGTSLNVSLFARVRDLNSNTDISNGPFTGTFYHDTNSDTGDELCTNDNNNCYQVTCNKVVNITGGTDAWLRCDYSLEYYADHSDLAPQWIAYMEMNDSSGTPVNNAGAYSTEVLKLVSATFPLVDFGTRLPGTVTTAANNTVIQHRNNGNVLIDLRAGLDNADFDSSLDCNQIGNILNTNVTFDIVDADFGAASYILPVDPGFQEFDIDIQQRSNDLAPVVNDATGDIQQTYWNVSVPVAGVRGFCDEGLVVTVFEGP